MRILKAFGVLVLFLIALALAFVAGVGYGAYYVLTPVGGENTVTVDIPKGASAGYVAEKLEKNNVIRNGLLFRMVMRATGSGHRIKPGKYMISPKSTMLEILHQLKTGEGLSELNLVTVPEGLTLRQIAALLGEKKVVGKSDFVQAAMENAYYLDGKKLPKLEGYLLPETYDFPKSFTADDVIKRMLSEFENKALPEYKKQKDNLPRKMSLYEILVLASLIEREAQVPSERPIIASVYYNRLKKNMLLQCDATVQYALGKQKPVLTYQDLEIDSPYNTYRHKGLPPGPIANPGLDSIKAALNPESTDYLYYVRNDVKNDGSHVFTRSAAEHDAAVRQYQK